MVSTFVIGCLTASMLTGVLVLALIYLACRRRMQIRLRNILVGAGVFFLFVALLERALHQVLLATPATANWLHTHPLAFALYGCCAAAVFEEVGRYIGLRLFAVRTGIAGTGVAYGLGHGGLELVLLGSVGAINAIVLAVLLNTGQLEANLGTSVPAEQLVQIRAQILGLTPGLIALSLLERLAALMIQIGLSVLVWASIERRRLALWLLALGLHALVDFPAGLFQAGLLPLAPVEALTLTTGAVLAVVFALKLRHIPAMQGRGTAAGGDIAPS